MADTETQQYRVKGAGAIYQKQHETLGPDGKVVTVMASTLAVHGETIDLVPFEAHRLLALDAIKPADEPLAYDEMDDTQLASLVAVRGLDVRGTAADGTVRREDQINALTIHDQGNLAANPAAGDVDKLAEHLTTAKLTVDDTVALAGSDPAQAQRVLEAEHVASGQNPRAGVVSKLQKIIDGE